MKAYINSNGLFLGIFDNNQKPLNSVEIEVLPTSNELKYIKLIYADGVYYEGATPEELQTIQNQKKENAKQDITNLYTQLYRSALSRATGKTGTLEYLLLQKKEYEDKYKCAMEVINNQPISNQFTFEQIADEKEFEDFVGDILYHKIIGINQMSCPHFFC
jgi:hypothetical protein